MVKGGSRKETFRILFFFLKITFFLTTLSKSPLSAFEALFLEESYLKKYMANASQPIFLAGGKKTTETRTSHSP